MAKEKRAIPDAQNGNEAAVTPTVEGGQAVRLTRLQRFFWIALSVFSGAYILFPLDFWPELMLGLVGLLDDGVAGMVLLFSLSKLGIHIPLLSRFVHARTGAPSNEKSVN